MRAPLHAQARLVNPAAHLLCCSCLRHHPSTTLHRFLTFEMCVCGWRWVQYSLSSPFSLLLYPADAHDHARSAESSAKWKRNATDCCRRRVAGGIQIRSPIAAPTALLCAATRIPLTRSCESCSSGSHLLPYCMLLNRCKYLSSQRTNPQFSLVSLSP